MEGRHAYLIMAHGEWEVLSVLLSLIDDARNDIFLHVDSKAGPLPALYQPRRAGFFLTDRHDVRWGDFSQVEAELCLLRAARQHGTYLYYHRLSGVCLPLRSQDFIHDFFARHAGREFVGFFPDTPYNRADIRRKVSRYYVLMRWNMRCPFVPLYKRLPAQVVRHALLRLQDLLHTHRGWQLEFRKAYNWASLTEAAVDYVLEREPFIRRRFRHISCADELYLGSLLWSSPLRERIYDPEDATRGSLRLVDFERATPEARRQGQPYTWQDGDAAELLRSDCLFARKFSNKALGVVQAVARSIQKPSQ